MSRCRLIAVRCLIWALISSAPALLCAQSADAPALTDGARAVEKGREGLVLFEQGNWPDALARFREAEDLYHSPVFVLYGARCLRKLGKLLEARGALQGLAGEALAASVPAPWHKAQADARTELEELAAEIPSVRLTVEGGSVDTLLSLDDRAVTAGTRIEIDPGQHRASASDGQQQASSTFFAERGSAQQDIVLRLPALEPPRPSGHVATAPAVRKEVLRASSPPSKRGLYVPGLVLTGTGAAAAAAGAVFGVLALNKFSTLRESADRPCRPSPCLMREKPAVDRHFEPAERLALVSDVLWIGGAVVATAGVVLVLVDPRRDVPANVSLHVAPARTTLRLAF